MTGFDPKRVFELCPNAEPLYLAAFVHANTVLLPFGILLNERRLTHFLAQVLHESAGLTTFYENLSYNPRRLMEVWPARFPSLGDAAPYAHNPQALANKVYAGRLGNVAENDGWTFRGRGLLQITGRFNYARISKRIGVDLVGDPDLALQPEYALQVAAAIWDGSNCNPLADINDIEKVTKAINGGTVGLLQRKQWFAKVQSALGIVPPREV